MKIALYARVSKRLEQNPENQLIALREWAQRAGHDVIGEFVDEISTRDTRPAKEEVLGLLRLGEADGVAFYALDRWGRSIDELVLGLDEAHRRGWAVFSLKEQIDLGTAAGRMMSQMLAVFAAFERDRISERTKLGQARARALGKKIGRPRKHPIKTGAVKPRISPDEADLS